MSPDDDKILSSLDDDKILAPLDDEDEIESPLDLDNDDDEYDNDGDIGDDDNEDDNNDDEEKILSSRDPDDDDNDDGNEIPSPLDLDNDDKDDDNDEILSPLEDNKYSSMSEDESEDPILRLIRRARRPKPKRPRCPTISFPCAQMPNVCANIRNAFRMGKPRQLQRTTNPSQIRRNRRQSGCRRLGRRTGYNCDEYPFASSLQGGSGAVVKLVPIRENSVQGGMLAAFYRRNNIGHGGCFKVKV